jgi:hypothetical protein
MIVAGGGSAYGGQERQFADGHRKVVMLLFVAESTGHAAAPAVNRFVTWVSGSIRSMLRTCSAVPRAF